MGNTPGKQGMNSKRKRGGPASSRRQEASPPPIQTKRSKTKVRDDDVVVVETKKPSSKLKDVSKSNSRLDDESGPSRSSVSAGPASSLLPKAGPLKIKAMSAISRSVGQPKRDSSVSETKKPKSRKREDPLAALIPAKSGPRAEVNESDYFKIQGIMKKWVGKSDQALNDEFYLVHWANRPPSKSSDDDAWLHRSQLKDCDEMIEKADQEYEKMKEERSKKRTKKPYYEIVSDSDDEKEKKKKEEEVQGLEIGSGKVLRIRNSNLNFNEDGKDVKHPTPRRTVSKKEPVGFERKLPVDKVVAVANYNGTLAYLLKFEGSTKCDLVPSSICREKIPEMLVDFLKPKISGIEEIDEASLSPESKKAVRKAWQVSEKIIA